MPRARAIDTLSVSEINQILRRKQKQLRKLQKARAQLVRKLKKIDDEIAMIGGDGAGGAVNGAGRVRNAKSLPDTLADVLAKAGKPMAVGDIVSGVRAAGYRSNSASFRAIVNQTLIKERKRFAQVSRGVYQLRK